MSRLLLIDEPLQESLLAGKGFIRHMALNKA
jgi:hypothetical protein